MFVKYEVAARDGYLFIKETSPVYTEPVLETWWWPIGTKAYGRDHLIGREVWPDGNGRYHDADFFYYLLEHAGDTKAAHIDRQSISPPKSRCDLRWHQGEWQKYLKTKGWVRA